MGSMSSTSSLAEANDRTLDAKVLAIFRCVRCFAQQLSSPVDGTANCANCKQSYHVKHRILDTIVAATPALTNELQGMAREAGMNADHWQDYKIRRVPALPTLAALQNGTQNDAGHYYKQTIMNFEQASALLPDLKPSSRVLEIGSEAPFTFLERFRSLGADCYALNIYFPFTEPDPYYEWPTRVLGDMNHLPFAEQSFDVIIISATSHHTPTPERLLSEVARVLKRGGKALLINDPLAGLIKGVGGSLAHHRDPLINENTYTLGRYQRAFAAVNLKPKHLFSAYWDIRLQTADIHPDTRFATLAKVLARIWRVTMFRNLIKNHLLWLLQIVFGFPLNVVLSKDSLE